MASLSNDSRDKQPAESPEGNPKAEGPYHQSELLDGLVLVGGGAERTILYGTREHVHEPTGTRIVTLSNSYHGICAFALQLRGELPEKERAILEEPMFSGSEPFKVIDEVTRHHGSLKWLSLPNLDEHEFHAAMAEILDRVFKSGAA